MKVQNDKNELEQWSFLENLLLVLKHVRLFDF